MWIEPKTDWTPEDYYNFEDLDRVENNMEEIATMIGHFDVPPTLITVTDRTMKRIEFQDSLERVDSNINLLTQRYKPLGWDQGELNTPFDYRDALRWEQNLYLLYFYYSGNIDNFRHCGAYTCGEEVI